MFFQIKRKLLLFLRLVEVLTYQGGGGACSKKSSNIFQHLAKNKGCTLILYVSLSFTQVFKIFPSNKRLSLAHLQMLIPFKAQ